VTGLVVTPGDAASLAAAINLLLDDAAMAERFGAAARERAQREFSHEVMAERVLRVYERVTGQVLLPTPALATS
jgi:glycosyltransferase involved in cell wall biosynthesis